MSNFVVTKLEKWRQVVLVEDVDTPEEAKQRAAEGFYTMAGDPEFENDIDSADWKVEKEQ